MPLRLLPKRKPTLFSSDIEKMLKGLYSVSPVFSPYFWEAREIVHWVFYEL